MTSQPQEISGKPGIDASSPLEADIHADKLIREVIVEQKRTESRGALPALDPASPGAATTKIRHPRRLFKLSRIRPAKETPDAQKATVETSASVPVRLVLDLIARTAGYRPTRKHLFVAVVALIFLWRPWLIPILLFVTFLTVLIAYFSLGPDRVAELVVNFWRRLHARRPQLAETIRQRAEIMARRIDAFLDRLPGKWTDGLHVPDFAPNEDDLDDRPDPFERLAKQGQHG